MAKVTIAECRRVAAIHGGVVVLLPNGKARIAFNTLGVVHFVEYFPHYETQNDAWYALRDRCLRGLRT